MMDPRPTKTADDEASAASRPAGFLERYFDLRNRGTTIRREVLGGVATFAAMAYIIVVNPAILQAGFKDVPIGALTVATVLSAVFGCLLMGFYANRPLAVAPYMGENAFIVYSLALAGIGWQLRLGSVFVAGLVFLLITLLQLRSWLAAAISPSLKHSFGVGIGLFLALIGLVTSKIVGQGPPVAPLRLATPLTTEAALAIAGFTLMSILMAHKVPGAILLGMVLTGLAGVMLGVGGVPTGVVALPLVGDYDIRPIALHLDILGVLRLDFLPILLTLILISFLDTLGTLIAVGDAGGLLDEQGNLPDIEQPMFVDAVSCIFSSLIGTSTSGAYIESAVGVREGARTGLAAVTTGVLFAFSLFFLPLFAPLQNLGYVYGPALIAVGVLMMGSASKIRFDDVTEAVPAFATIALMVFTYNIANGLTAGLILHPILKIAAGRWREVNSGSVALAGMCVVYYALGIPH